MAIYSASISDDVINTLLASPDKNQVALGKEYMDAKEQTDKELGRDKGFMGLVSDVFGFGSAQGAEPDINTGQRFTNQFSVTQTPQFDLREIPAIPGNIDMRNSVFSDYPYDINNVSKGGIYNFTPEITYDANPGFIKTSEGSDENERNYFDLAKNFFTNPAMNAPRGLASLALTGNPVLAALSFFGPKIAGGISDAGGGIINAFKNFNDRRKGRLNITADMGIMPGKQLGALTTADDYGRGSDDGGRSESEQSFSDSQSYGGGGSMDDQGADSFI
jgi:hypothetical protein